MHLVGMQRAGDLFSGRSCTLLDSSSAGCLGDASCDELVGIVTLDALQDLCHNPGRWTSEYGVMPTNSNYNIFNGTGITFPVDAEFMQDVMLTSQHSEGAGRKLADVCKALLLGADALEEETFAAISLDAASIEDAVVRYKKELCLGHGGACTGIELAA